MHVASIKGPRSCRKADLSEMISLVNRVMREGSDQSFQFDYPLVYRDKNLENIQIIKVDGELVSVVPFIDRPIVLEDCRFSIGIISPTATAPDHRKKGYALQCLGACIEKMHAEGIDLSVLWTQVETFPFYEKGGYHPVRSQGWIYRLGANDRECFQQQGEKVVTCDPSNTKYLQDIRAIHEREAGGVCRAGQEYRALFDLPKMKTLLALRDGKGVAYLLVSSAVNKPGLVEAGGDCRAVETLISTALAELQRDSNYLAYAYLTPSVLGTLLAEKLPHRREPMVEGPQMIRINNFRSFFGKISSWLVKKNAGKLTQLSLGITDTAEVISLDFADDQIVQGADRCELHLEMNSQEWTGVIFGSHPERPIETPGAIKHLFPFYFPIWMLDHS